MRLLSFAALLSTGPVTPAQTVYLFSIDGLGYQLSTKSPVTVRVKNLRRLAARGAMAGGLHLANGNSPAHLAPPLLRPLARPFCDGLFFARQRSGASSASAPLSSSATSPSATNSAISSSAANNRALPAPPVRHALGLHDRQVLAPAGRPAGHKSPPITAWRQSPGS